MANSRFAISVQSFIFLYNHCAFLLGIGDALLFLTLPIPVDETSTDSIAFISAESIPEFFKSMVCTAKLPPFQTANAFVAYVKIVESQ